MGEHCLFLHRLQHPQGKPHAAGGRHAIDSKTKEAALATISTNQLQPEPARQLEALRGSGILERGTGRGSPLNPVELRVHQEGQSPGFKSHLCSVAGVFNQLPEIGVFLKCFVLRNLQTRTKEKILQSVATQDPMHHHPQLM